MMILGLAAVGGLSLWVAIAIGRGLSGARFNRALRAYGGPVYSMPETLASHSGGSSDHVVANTGGRRARVALLRIRS